MNIWKPDYLKMFICHVARHKKEMAELKDQLAREGISAFVAHEDIAPTRQWQTVIELALSTADVLLAWLTPDFHASEWTDQEIGVAIGRDILIIPAKAGIDPYGLIGKYQAYTTEPDMRATAKGISDICIKHDLTSMAMARALVAKLENSQSFDGAKANMERLQRVKSFDQGLADRLKLALKSNSQVSGSFTVPSKAVALIKKFGLK